MRLVSAEEATERLASLREGHVTNAKAHIEHLYETILALWPIVAKAAREPCTVPNGPCEVWLDDRAQWCSRCLARRLLAQVKEAQL